MNQIWRWLACGVLATQAAMSSVSWAEELTPESERGEEPLVVQFRSERTTQSRRSGYLVSDLPADAQAIASQLDAREAEIQRKADAEIQILQEGAIAQLRVIASRYAEQQNNAAATSIQQHISQIEYQFAAKQKAQLNITSYRGQIGKTITARVIGMQSGYVWGSDVYTDDSDPGTAAVHAGLVKAGESATLTITILPGQNSYTGSTKNGVTSTDYQSWYGSMHLSRGNEPTRASVVPTISSSPTTSPEAADYLYGRGAVGDVVTQRVTGTVDGTVWGEGPYTDDSSIATAAVHAGILKAGQTGWVSMKIVEGQSSYASGTRNGVSTYSYGSWSRSFVFVTDRTPPKPEPVPSVIIQPGIKRAPESMTEYRDKIGQSFVFDVTASRDGFVYGTDIYTDDSSIATAVVHAGLMQPGQRGTVRVTMLPDQASYRASTRNGI